MIPGAGAAGGADYVDGLLGAFPFDPPRIWAGGPFSGRHGGDAGFEPFLPLGALEELAWRTRIEGTRGPPEREFNGPVIGWQERYADGLAALGDDFADARRREQDRRAATPTPAFRHLLYEHACEGDLRRPGLRRQPGRAGWRRDRLPRRRPAAGLDRRRGRGPDVAELDCDAVIVGTGPGGLDRRRRAHRGRLVGGRPGEGSQPPPRPRRRRTGRYGALLQRRDQVRPPPLPRPGPAARAPHLPPHARPTATACSPATSTTCRPRSAAAASTPTASSPASGRRTSALLSARAGRGRRRRRLAPRLRRPRAVLRRGRAPDRRGGRGDGANPFAAWRSGPYPMPPGADMFGARPVRRGRRAARAAPLPGADRRQQRALRRPAGLQQLRVLRRLRLPDPRQGRPGRLAAPGPAHRPLRAPARGVRHRRRSSTPAGGGPPASATSTPHGAGARGPGRRTSCWPPAPSRPPGCCCATASATRRAWSAATSRTTSRPSRSAASPIPLHGERGRASPTSTTTSIVHGARATRGRPRRRAPVDPRRHRRARRRGPARSRRRSSTPPGRGTTAVDARLRAAGPALGRSPCRARTCPSRPTGSTSTRRSATPGASPPGGSPTRPTATSWSPSPTSAPDPRGGACVDAGAEWCVLRHLAARRATSTPRRQPARHGAGQQARHGHLPHGRRPGDQRGRRPTAASTTSTTCSCADSSVFVTSAGYNPTLTIVALAHRAVSCWPAPRERPGDRAARSGPRPSARAARGHASPYQSRVRAGEARVAGPAYTWRWRAPARQPGAARRRGRRGRRGPCSSSTPPWCWPWATGVRCSPREPRREGSPALSSTAASGTSPCWRPTGSPRSAC